MHNLVFDHEACNHAATHIMGLTAAANSGQAHKGASAAMAAVLLPFARWPDGHHRRHEYGVNQITKTHQPLECYSRHTAVRCTSLHTMDIIRLALKCMCLPRKQMMGIQAEKRQVRGWEKILLYRDAAIANCRSS